MAIKKSYGNVIRKLVYLAMLTALVVVLQLVVAPIIGATTGLSPALVLIPIVLGVASCGIGAGAWLGAVFSLIVMFDPSTVPFIEYNLFLTIFLVFVKGMGSGVVAGALFKELSRFNKYLGVVVAAISAPIVNTSIFVVGCLLFFREINGLELYLVFAAKNFALEFVINAVLVPAIHHLLEVTRILNKR